MDEIIAWLSEDGPFGQGVRLLAQAGGRVGEYERIVKRGLVTYSDRQKLRADLQALVAQYQAAPSPMPSPPARPRAAKLREEGKLLLKQRAYLRGQMRAAATDEARYVLADKIMREVSPAIDRVYDAIRAIEAGGEDVEEAAATPKAIQEAITQFRRRESLRSIIARKKRELAKLDGEAATAMEAEIHEHEVEYEALNERLGL